MTRSHVRAHASCRLSPIGEYCLIRRFPVSLEGMRAMSCWSKTPNRVIFLADTVVLAHLVTTESRYHAGNLCGAPIDSVSSDDSLLETADALWQAHAATVIWQDTVLRDFTSSPALRDACRAARDALGALPVGLDHPSLPPVAYCVPQETWEATGTDDRLRTWRSYAETIRNEPLLEALGAAEDALQDRWSGLSFPEDSTRNTP